MWNMWKKITTGPSCSPLRLWDHLMIRKGWQVCLLYDKAPESSATVKRPVCKWGLCQDSVQWNFLSLCRLRISVENVTLVRTVSKIAFSMKSGTDHQFTGVFWVFFAWVNVWRVPGTTKHSSCSVLTLGNKVILYIVLGNRKWRW